MADFFYQNGFGSYIWVSYLSAFVLMAVEILMLRGQRKKQIERIRRITRLKSR